jgi:hypothetical protein
MLWDHKTEAILQSFGFIKRILIDNPLVAKMSSECPVTRVHIKILGKYWGAMDKGWLSEPASLVHGLYERPELPIEIKTRYRYASRRTTADSSVCL